MVAVVTAGGVFLEIERLHRIGLGAIGQAREEARHRQTQVTRVFRFAQRAPGRVFGGREDLREVTRVREFLP